MQSMKRTKVPTSGMFKILETFMISSLWKKKTLYLKAFTQLAKMECFLCLICKTRNSCGSVNFQQSEKSSTWFTSQETCWCTLPRGRCSSTPLAMQTLKLNLAHSSVKKEKLFLPCLISKRTFIHASLSKTK